MQIQHIIVVVVVVLIFVFTFIVVFVVLLFLRSGAGQKLRAPPFGRALVNFLYVLTYALP